MAYDSVEPLDAAGAILRGLLPVDKSRQQEQRQVQSWQSRRLAFRKLAAMK